MNKLNLLMGESRFLKLEATERNFGAVFSDEQRKKMKWHIQKLKLLTSETANKAN
ncbi:hypothetical protein [Bathymodiolus thermophilus thioautotrophic gill symbiont]|uniref:hypothetical protein n=1 Tax=Bathymodiolus thermophilus thioautotrophic gill symbiont TaxID=2360 RepID=UPI0013DF1561|nr:hypothetical protein [Bathymodiolus thermophilus thioautotrophic gill symbiont]